MPCVANSLLALIVIAQQLLQTMSPDQIFIPRGNVFFTWTLSPLDQTLLDL